MAMDAILATVAGGVRAIVDIDREVGRNYINNLFNLLFYIKP
jgi:hypothetical protein